MAGGGGNSPPSKIAASVSYRELNFFTNLGLAKLEIESFTWPEYALKSGLLPEKGLNMP